MTNDPISKWANEAQKRANVEYAPALPKNSINTPIEFSKEELIKDLHDFKKENVRLRQNNEYYKLEYIEIKQKLLKIIELINK